MILEKGELYNDILLLTGRCLLNTSNLTGEATPISKSGIFE